MVERYLMATDGKQSTNSLVRYVQSRFDPDEVSISVICVADESRVVPYLMAEEAGTGGLDPSEIHGRLEEQAKSISDRAVEMLEEKGFEASAITDFGNPGAKICERASGDDVAEILISRRSHTAVGELLLGSVSQYVIHHADRPVTLVPLDEE